MDHASHAQDAPHGPLRSVPAARDRIAAAVREHGSGTPADGPAGIPRLPADEGLEAVRPLDGDAWLVREVRSGEHFVLHVCSGRTAPERERSWAGARALAVGLAGCDDPHLVAVRGLLGPAAEPVGVVEEHLTGGCLADRLAGPDRPGPAELALVLHDAAAGLAVLHGRGRCHGALTARQILFRSSWPGAGRGGADRPPPAALRAGNGAGSPQEDVRDLGTLAWTALTGRAPAEGSHRVPLTVLRPDLPPGLLRAVEAALAEDPADRPSAADLAARLARSAEETPAPVGTGVRRTPAGRERRSRRRTAPLAAGVVLLLGGVGALLGLTGSPEAVPVRAQPGPGPGTTAVAREEAGGAPRAGVSGAPRESTGAADEPVPSDPRTALTELVARRGTALRTGDARLLDQVYATDAAAGVADRRLLARAAENGGAAFAELELSVGAIRDGARGESSGRRTAVYVADVHVDGYPGGPGDAPAVVAAGDTWVQTVEVVVVLTDRGWRLGAVVPATSGEQARVLGPPARTAPETVDPRR